MNNYYTLVVMMLLDNSSQIIPIYNQILEASLYALSFIMNKLDICIIYYWIIYNYISLIQLYVTLSVETVGCVFLRTNAPAQQDGLDLPVL